MIQSDKTHGVSKWDNPAKNDLFGREPFVDAIVKTIEDSDEGFNFGISARWGEGKSSILQQLQPKLEALNYKVLKFEPWKYTQDEISIKRKFIIDIYSQLDKKIDHGEFYAEIQKDKDLTKEEYDDIFTRQINIFLKHAFLLGMGFVVVVWSLKHILGVRLNVTQTLLNNLLLPIFLAFIPVIQKVTEIKVKQIIPKIESAEQFEDKFNEVVEELMASGNPPKRIVIFVDDLDRCNHKEVEQILTALFTFFNNPHCVYVITADHTVIRRYISNFLNLDPELNDTTGLVDIKKTTEVKQKEATEYLKKIFQINFILPKATKDVLGPWVNQMIDATSVLNFTHPYAKEYLIDLALNNFDSNPRKIKHFLRTLFFQLEAVQGKLNSIANKNSQEYTNLVKVKNSPELLGKILIIQDRFPDFYEKLPNEPKLLQGYESGEIAEDKDLQKLIAQEPKFFNSINRSEEEKTIDPYYFLHFSGSTGFTETRTVDPTEIKALAKNGDIENLTKIITGLTDLPRNSYIEGIKAEYDLVQTQAPEKINIIRSLFHAVSLLEEPRLRLQRIKELLVISRQKYATELAALQSIDIEKILPFIDKESADVLVKEPPFIDAPTRSQIINAFIAEQKSLTPEIAEGFENLIAEKLTGSDEDFDAALGFIKKLFPERFTESETIQHNLVEALKNKANNQKELVIDLINQFRGNITSARINEIEAALFTIASGTNVADQVFVAGMIQSRVNLPDIDFNKFVEIYIDNAKKASDADLDQIVNAIFHPDMKKEFGDRLIPFLESLAKQLGSGNEQRRFYILSKLEELIKSVDYIVSSQRTRSTLLREIKNIEDKTVDEQNKALITQLIGLLEPRKKETRKTKKWLPI
ncbi:MAG: hypothetical protein A3G02_02190 [Candidatus Yanofskybacteria bacterium RIFCSPLOWO2_12_FULL_44_13b]|uniref:KAP NTPase domain-containing protein n=1 Tax=Candidatus Yanofskybacteria bacterium RIFCSPLOWO2_02_FULL_44_18 TaxID=1802705 RepID=A0A1F8H191_9BACT|nr:MAG: hypothetical protein UW14_C0003G0022 [Candidatus Yanofskybacteria bacterium GW2011_GWA2_44_10]OGN14380.1 MAG: hypothetical protein A3C01_02855 [Candidatus Yanofskybacteria bacterium RIFCSPHIGHO2_02_FULL_44_36b]OGN18986.1 MAG: hypothetical protein A3F50_00015 [Candidatus Yanofskybacteria bacterium RIFCSPHIGHO2_12_FULL_44_29b]OGN26498.1 MAG: hypothetical protein A3B12_03140 [Candidatus Yanofskybacteria bacterium RIFCSPLOWO2_01_FULL_44_88]OGN31442.1 MAG: hypothetical protein A3I96_01245 [C